MRYLLLLFALPVAAASFTSIECTTQYKTMATGQISPLPCTLGDTVHANFEVTSEFVRAFFVLSVLGGASAPNDYNLGSPDQPAENLVYFEFDIAASASQALVVRGGTGQGKLVGRRDASNEVSIERYDTFWDPGGSGEDWAFSYESNFLPADVQGGPFLYPHEVSFTFDVPFTLSMDGRMWFRSVPFGYRAYFYERSYQAATDLNQILDLNGAPVAGAYIELVPVPEPATYVLMGLGLAGLAIVRISRRVRAAAKE